MKNFKEKDAKSIGLIVITDEEKEINIDIEKIMKEAEEELFGEKK